MSQKADLLKLLVELPDVDTVAKRQALIDFIGFSFIGIYLDWEGTTVEFCSRLVGELIRRGRETLVKFLQNLPGAPQVGIDRDDKVAALQTAIQALDQAAWEAEFGLPPAEAKPAQAPDKGRLALTVVTNLLTPHFQTADAARSKTVTEIVSRLDQVLAANPFTASGWNEYKETPEDNEKTVLDWVKTALDADDGLTSGLADLVDTATKPPAPGERPEVNVVNEARIVKGSLVGVVVSKQVLNDINVTQKIDTIEAGGSVVGVKL
jgi:hypothetical protein